MANPICADWQITSRCSRTCNYCYGPTGVEDLTFYDAKKVVDTLKEIGVKMISLTGGEPLERNDIDKVIHFSSDKYYFQAADISKGIIRRVLKAGFRAKRAPIKNKIFNYGIKLLKDMGAK